MVCFDGDCVGTEPGQSPSAGDSVAIMDRYVQVLPAVNICKRCKDWTLRFRGLLKSTFVKPQ